MALKRWNLQPYAMCVVDAACIREPFDGGAKEDLYDLNPPYQRGSVWTAEQRVNLIRSLLEGIPCGIVYRNFRGFHRAKPYVIVDGKQRIETIRGFVAGEFSVPADWFREQDLAEGAGSEVSYLGLSVDGRRIFDHCSLAVYETRLPSEAEERILYERVNYGGTPHDPMNDEEAT